MKRKNIFVMAVVALSWLYATQGHTISLTGKRGPADFSDIAEPLLPSVVNISTTTVIKRDKRQEMMPQFPPGSPLEELLRPFMEGNQGDRSRKAMSLGSGFLIGQEGDVAYIVTCNHVIADADDIKIVMHNDAIEYKAEIVGRDRRTDLALLKVKTPKKMVIAEWGDSSKSRVGEWIIAMGNPFGLGGTVTAGIVSSIARDIGASSRLGAADYVNGYIQTDAPINMGNSGGPMFNMDGKVIGICTAIFSPNGGSIGIGFGIPSDLAKKVIEQLKEYGRTKRGWIGVQIQPVDQTSADAFGLKEPKGALINGVTKGSPSDKAGMKSGDIIIKFNDKDVADSRQLQHLVGEALIGSKIPVVIWRTGKQVNVEVTIGEFEKAEEEGYITTPIDEPKMKAKGEKVLGLVAEEITPAAIEKYELNHDAKGIIVTYVEPGSNADSVGIKAGDIIVAVVSGAKRMDIKKPADLKTAIDKLKNENMAKVLLLVNANGKSRYISLPLEEQSSSDKD
jgi:serine protease Do